MAECVRRIDLPCTDISLTSLPTFYMIDLQCYRSTSQVQPMLSIVKLMSGDLIFGSNRVIKFCTSFSHNLTCFSERSRCNFAQDACPPSKDFRNQSLGSWNLGIDFWLAMHTLDAAHEALWLRVLTICIQISRFKSWLNLAGYFIGSELQGLSGGLYQESS